MVRTQGDCPPAQHPKALVFDMHISSSHFEFRNDVQQLMQEAQLARCILFSVEIVQLLPTILQSGNNVVQLRRQLP